MKKTLLISHFGLAGGALNTLEYFIGDTTGYTAINAYVDGVNPDEAIEEFFNSCDPEDKVVVFTDIMGGSVCQKVSPYILTRPNTYIYAGFNFPMLLQATTLDEDSEEDDFRALVSAGTDGVVFVNDAMAATSYSEDDE